MTSQLASLDLAQPLAFLATGIGYLLGSIPFGLLLTRLFGLGDIRAIGSGNIGATNVLRTGKKGLAAVTLLLDALKGTLAVILGAWLAGPAGALLAGAGAFLGHLFPAWLGFRGGKGVATYLGVALGLVWQAALVFAVGWLAVAAVTRYSSMAALVASLLTTATMFFLAPAAIGVAFAVMTTLLWLRHRENIRRLLAGTEGRIGGKA